jgi:hypothetical protein
VTSSEGVVHGAVEAGHERPLATVFGEVTVRRRAYQAVLKLRAVRSNGGFPSYWAYHLAQEEAVPTSHVMPMGSSQGRHDCHSRGSTPE